MRLLGAWWERLCGPERVGPWEGGWDFPRGVRPGRQCGSGSWDPGGGAVEKVCLALPGREMGPPTGPRWARRLIAQGAYVVPRPERPPEAGPLVPQPRTPSVHCAPRAGPLLATPWVWSLPALTLTELPSGARNIFPEPERGVGQVRGPQ